MFHDWETFYLLTGTSAAALVGVMFIVTTLTAEISEDLTNRGTIIYLNPTVFHLGAIVAASSLVLIPDHLITIAAIVLVLIGVAGAVYAAVTLLRTYEKTKVYEATVWDRLFFGALPAVFYLLIGVGGAAVFAGSEVAAEAVSAGALLLLLVSIRNAWDVATFATRVSRAHAAGQRDK